MLHRSIEAVGNTSREFLQTALTHLLARHRHSDFGPSRGRGKRRFDSLLIHTFDYVLDLFALQIAIAVGRTMGTN